MKGLITCLIYRVGLTERVLNADAQFLIKSNLVSFQGTGTRSQLQCRTVRVLNYNLTNLGLTHCVSPRTNIVLLMRETTEHCNPVTQKDRVLPSPAYCNADDTTTFLSVCFRPSLTFRSDQWQIQENQGMGQCPLSNQHGWH